MLYCLIALMNVNDTSLFEVQSRYPAHTWILSFKSHWWIFFSLLPLCFTADEKRWFSKGHNSLDRRMFYNNQMSVCSIACLQHLSIADKTNLPDTTTKLESPSDNFATSDNFASYFAQTTHSAIVLRPLTHCSGPTC